MALADLSWSTDSNQKPVGISLISTHAHTPENSYAVPCAALSRAQNTELYW